MAYAYSNRSSTFKEEARQLVRAKTAAKVEVIAGLSRVYDPHTIRGTCVEVSVGGAVILLYESLDEGDKILVSFNIHSELIECAAIVTDCRRARKADRYFVECQFQGVSDTNYYYLSVYVFEQLLPYR